MNEKKIYFEPKDGAPTPVRVSHGEYTREFQGAKWPQEATEEEWESYLLPTGLFRVKEGQARGPARTK